MKQTKIILKKVMIKAIMIIITMNIMMIWKLMNVEVTSLRKRKHEESVTAVFKLSAASFSCLLLFSSCVVSSH